MKNLDNTDVETNYQESSRKGSGLQAPSDPNPPPPRIFSNSHFRA